MCDTAGFVRHRANTGTVFAGTGTVLKIPTRGIPVQNPTPHSVAIFLPQLLLLHPLRHSHPLQSALVGHHQILSFRLHPQFQLRPRSSHLRVCSRSVTCSPLPLLQFSLWTLLQKASA